MCVVRILDHSCPYLPIGGTTRLWGEGHNILHAYYRGVNTVMSDLLHQFQHVFKEQISISCLKTRKYLKVVLQWDASYHKHLTKFLTSLQDIIN